MKRIIVGISGASGAIYGIRTLEVFQKIGNVESHLILTNAGKLTINAETSWQVKEVMALADVVHEISNVGASIASGSFKTEGMIIAPCSIKSMSMIANAMSDNLLIRAADVCLKEQRKLILMVRETPVHLGHLRLMTQLAETGAVIAPPVPAFYHNPVSLDDLINHTVGRVLSHFGVDAGLFQSWNGLAP